MFFLILLMFSLPGVGINVPPAAAVQPAQQAPAGQAAPQPAHTANMQPQAIPQHQQLLMKQQQAAAFLSPQSNQQVGILTEHEWKYFLVTLSKSHSRTWKDNMWQCWGHMVTYSPTKDLSLFSKCSRRNVWNNLGNKSSFIHRIFLLSLAPPFVIFHQITPITY